MLNFEKKEKLGGLIPKDFSTASGSGQVTSAVSI